MDGWKKIIFIAIALVAALAVPVAIAQVASQDTIAGTISGYSDLTTLVKAVNSAGLGSMLASKGPYTLFAPTDSAFNQFTPGTMSNLLQDKQKIGDIMMYHIVPGKLTISDLANVGSVRTVDGRTLPVTVKDGYIDVGGAKVINRGVSCTNGMIYPVDNVIIPATTGTGVVAPAQYTPQQAPQQAPAATKSESRGIGGVMLLGLLIIGALILGGLLLVWLLWRFLKGLFGFGRPRPEYRPPPKPGYTRPPGEGYARPPAEGEASPGARGEVREPAQFGTQGTSTMRDEGPYIATGPTAAAPVGGLITFDESAVNELRSIDKSRLTSIRQTIIGVYNDFLDKLELARDAHIDLENVRDNNAVRRFMERYRLSPFNSNTLELALERNATIYTKDPVLMGIYRAAGARVEDLRKLLPGA